MNYFQPYVDADKMTQLLWQETCPRIINGGTRIQSIHTNSEIWEGLAVELDCITVTL